MLKRVGITNRIWGLSARDGIKLGPKGVMRANISLIGFSGTGKTVVGKRISETLKWSYVDTDEKIENVSGMTVAEIFSNRGEIEFRTIEKRIISEVCNGDNVVVSTGGGAVLDQVNWERLRLWSFTIWLDALPETIFSRLTDASGKVGKDRPLLVGQNSLHRIKKMKYERDELYKRADLKIDTDGRPIAEITLEAIERYIMFARKSPE